MAIGYKICIDCADPHRLAAFWAEALEYVVEDHSAMIKSLLDGGRITDTDVATVDGRLRFRTAAAVRDPNAAVEEYSGTGRGGRVLFQVVPEAKTVKNRVHLDLHVGADRRDAVVKRLTEAGGAVIGHGEQGGSSWIVMADPEGNEFCVVTAV